MKSLRHASLCTRIDEAVDSGQHFLVATDFDGTLAPIAQTPDEVELPPAAVETLRQLAAAPGCTLLVVSGRSLSDLKTKIWCPAVLAGNHGLEIEGDGLTFEHQAAVDLKPVLERACSDVERGLVRWPGAFVERKGLTATVHFRHVPEREHHALRLAIRAQMWGYGVTFGLRAGRKALEIHPRVGWNKGSAVNWVREQLDLGDACCICIGDDRTDESMFENCSSAVTINVGQRHRTGAEYMLRDPAEVCGFLSFVAQRLPAHTEEVSSPKMLAARG